MAPSSTSTIVLAVAAIGLCASAALLYMSFETRKKTEAAKRQAEASVQQAAAAAKKAAAAAEAKKAADAATKQAEEAQKKESAGKEKGGFFKNLAQPAAPIQQPKVAFPLPV